MTTLAELPTTVQHALRVETATTALRVHRLFNDRRPSLAARTLALTAVLSAHLKAAGATEETLAEWFLNARAANLATPLTTAEWATSREYAATDDELPPDTRDVLIHQKD